MRQLQSKILVKILSKRLSCVLRDISLKSQCRFRPKRGTVNMGFAARHIQEKCKEQHQNPYMVFIDFTKAFDMIDKKLL